MEITVNNITTSVEVDANYELFEIIVTDASEEQAERYAIEARESADEAAISKDITTVKASEALASASNALTSENESESAATTATEQAILSAAARDESVSAKLAAQDSEDNALTSALDASLSAFNALASENAAELAASTIVDKIDFTGAVEGDILRHNGLIFDKSPEKVTPLAYFNFGKTVPSKVWAADSFDIRGLTPSNELVNNRAYQTTVIEGDSYRTIDTSSLLPDNNSRNFRFYLTVETRINADAINFCLYNNSSNYILVKIKVRGIFNVFETVNGVTTNIFSRSAQQYPERSIVDLELWWDNRDRRLFYYDKFSQNLIASLFLSMPTSGSMNAFGFFHTRSDAKFINYRAELK
jgi:hypothetical protein